MSTHNFQKGDLVICLANGEAFDGGNRVFKGKEYEVVEIINGGAGDWHDHMNGETRAGLIVRAIDDNRKLYPYVWKFLRFKKKEVDKIENPVRVCADDYTW